MSDQDTDHEMISESRTARWAWRVSLIPVLGVPLFFVLAFLALYNISKGCTGFWLLRRGVIAVLLINGPYWGLFFSGYSGYYPNIHKAYWFLPKHGIFRTVNIDPSSHELNESRQFWKYGTPEERWKWISWWESGQKKVEGESILNKRDGTWTSWHENGQKQEESIYRNGIIEGVETTWFEDGQKQSETIMSYLENGFYTNMFVTYWHKNGQVAKKGSIRIFWPDSHWISWHVNGRVESNGICENENDLPSGSWTYWNKSGHKTEGNYSEDGDDIGIGKRVGLWIESYTDGQIKSVNFYNDKGEEVGVWRYWDENGNTTQEKNYDNKGELVKSIEYKSGNPVKEIEYKKGKPVKITFYQGYSPVNGKK